MIKDYEATPEQMAEWTNKKSEAVGEVFEVKPFNQNIIELAVWIDDAIRKGGTKLAHWDDIYEGKTGRYLSAYKLVPMTEEDIKEKESRIHKVRLTYDPQL